MPIESIPLITLLGLLFGSTLLASRFSVGQYAPSTYIGLRLTLASIAFLILYAARFQGRRLPKDRALWKHATLLGVFGTAIPMNMIATSLLYQSSGITAILLTTGPAFTVVFAHFYLSDERLNGRKVFGVLLALSGALLLTLLGESGLPDVSKASPIGYILVTVAMVLGSAMTVYARKYMKDMESFDVAGVRMFAAALVSMPASILLVGFDLSGVTQAGYLALGWASLVGTFIGMLIAFYNVQRFGATAAAMTSYVIPIVAALGGLWILNETITPGMLGGMALIVAGIAILNERERRGSLPKPV